MSLQSSLLENKNTGHLIGHMTSQVCAGCFASDCQQSQPYDVYSSTCDKTFCTTACSFCYKFSHMLAPYDSQHMRNQYRTIYDGMRQKHFSPETIEKRKQRLITRGRLSGTSDVST